MRLDPAYVTGATVLSNVGRTVSLPSVVGHVAVLSRKFAGKWYFEFTTGAGTDGGIGVQAADPALTVSKTALDAVAMWVLSVATHHCYDGGTDTGQVGGGSPSYVAGDTFMVAADMDNAKIWFGRNGSWLSGDPAAGTTPARSTLTTVYGICPVVTGYTGISMGGTLRLTSKETLYTVPSGFTAWGDVARTLDPKCKHAHATLSNGNRTVADATGTKISGAFSDEEIVSRKVYFEAKFDVPGAAERYGIGIAAVLKQADDVRAAQNLIAFNATTGAPGDRIYVTDQGKVYERGTLKYTGSSFSASDTMMFAYDPATGNVWVGKNGSWWNSGNPATGVGPVYTLDASYTPDKSFQGAVISNSAGTYTATINFGSVAPTYTVPAGFSMFGAWWDSVAAAVPITATMAAVKKRIATLATAVASTTAMAGARKFSLSLPAAVNATTAFTNKRTVVATLAAAVAAATAMAPKSTYRVSFGANVGVATLIDLTEIPYLGYVANRENGAHSLYQNFDFNSMVGYNQVYYGARTDGLYVLDGITDVNGQAITARVRTGRDVLGVDQQKRVPEVWIGIKASGTMQVKVVTDSGATNVYNLVAANPQRSLARAKLGKGYRSDTMQFELTNTSGIDFDVDVIEIYPVILQRRVP